MLRLGAEVLVAEFELQTVRLARIYGVLVEDLDVEEPFLQVVGGDESYAGR